MRKRIESLLPAPISAASQHVDSFKLPFNCPNLVPTFIKLSVISSTYNTLLTLTLFELFLNASSALIVQHGAGLGSLLNGPKRNEETRCALLACDDARTPALRRGCIHKSAAPFRLTLDHCYYVLFLPLYKSKSHAEKTSLCILFFKSK
jgi:hypothetical protein